MSAFFIETITYVHHWTHRLFSFRTTRDPSFRFVNGQFVMIGLEVDGKPLLRAYSMASANHETFLEFLSIKVPDGPLTSRLQHVRVGDKLLVGKKPTGTLVHDNLVPGGRLYMFGTGTGLAPFMSLVQDPETYEKFDKVIIVHGVRDVAELAYRDLLSRGLAADETMGEFVSGKLLYYPTVTREAFEHTGRVTDLVRSNKLTADLGLPPLSPAEDRVMLCGSPAMLAEMRQIVEGRGFEEGSANAPATFVIEKAFVEK